MQNHLRLMIPMGYFSKPNYKSEQLISSQLISTYPMACLMMLLVFYAKLSMDAPHKGRLFLLLHGWSFKTI